MTTRTCPSCNTPLGDADTFCARCGIASTSTQAPKRRKVLWLWILIGVVIACPFAVVGIGLLASILIPQMTHDMIEDSARILPGAQVSPDGSALSDRPEDEIDRIVTALLEYAIRNQGKYPESFVELVTPDAEGASYIEDLDVLLDPWEREYVYEPPASAESLPRVWSLGPDGLPHTADDVQGTVMQADPPEEHR